MSDLTLKISADFDKAVKAFNDLADTSEETKKKMENYAKIWENKSIDGFIDKQKLLEVSLTGTKGEVAAMTTASNNYSKEIQRLINSGLSPEHDVIIKLREEQQKLNDKIKEANDIEKAKTDLMKKAQQAAVALYAAIGAGIAAVAAMTQKTAEMGDQYAKTAKIVGMTAEQFQELDYAAKMSGVNNLKSNLEKLNKTMVDVKNGSGTLTKYLQENDKQLLNQIQNVKSNEEAFNLLMDAIKNAPDEFTKAEIAIAAFGKSGQEMILMAENGVEGISELREEAKKYGIISNEAARNSELYIDAQTRLKKAVTGVSTELTSKLLPGVTQTINGIANFIASIDNWESVLTKVGYALAGVTAGLTAFLLVSKGEAIIHGLTTAMKALNGAIAHNPIGAIAVVVTAVLIPALIALYRNWDTVQTYISQGVARLEYAFKWLGSQIQEKFIIAVNGIKIAFLSLADIIVRNVLGAVAKFLDVLGKLPFVGEQFETAAASVRGFADSFSQATNEARESSREAIQAAREQQDAIEETLKTNLASIDEQSRARRQELEERKNQINDEYQLSQTSANNELELLEQTENEKQEIIARSEQEKNDIINKSLKERLEELALTEQQSLNEQVKTVENFLLQRAELESNNFEERLAYLQEQKEILLSEQSGFSEERIAIETAYNNSIKKLEQEQANFEKNLMQERVSVFSNMFGSFSQLLGAFGEKSRGAAIASKVLASAEAAINTALAATKALSSGPYPLNLIMMASTIAAGIAQQVQIATTQIPSAETGGRFIVPNNNGVDSVGLKVNPGEQIDVTPRGMTSQKESFNFQFLFDGSVFADITNKLARSGELYTLALAGNI